jgi:UDP-N-acetylglucosamine acyltransferase
MLEPAAVRLQLLEDQSNLHVAKSFGCSTLPAVAIHPSAIVSPRAQIAADVEIGPCAMIDDDVTIGRGCRIGAHVIIKRYTTMGQRNRIHPHAIIGGEPQHMGFRGEKTSLLIGDDNIIRENVTMHRATTEGAATRVGSRNFFMVGAHVGHNCVVANDCVAGMHSALGGHVEVEDHVCFGHEVRVHQFVRVGRFAGIGAHAKLTRDILPFLLADGEPCRVQGLNVEALDRAGFSAEEQQHLDRAVHMLLHEGMPRDIALQEMTSINDANVAHLVEFVRTSRRSFTREPRRRMTLAERLHTAAA